MSSGESAGVQALRAWERDPTTRVSEYYMDWFIAGYQQAEARVVEQIVAGLHDVALKLRVGATTFDVHSRGLMEQLADEWDDAAGYVERGDWRPAEAK